MNWYSKIKTASFAENVICTSFSGNHATILVSGRRYRYEGISGNVVCSRIDAIRKMKNKSEAGSQLSTLIRNLEQYRVKDD